MPSEMPPRRDTSIELSMDESQNRRLAAIMFTDIKGFSSIMETDESTAVGMVKAQREIIRRQIALHQGEERETIGDAFLVIFESAINAVQCAIDIQREILKYNQEREEEKHVWVRIGIHLGDIIVEEGSIFGGGVNLAARVEPLAEPGGVCITQQVLDQVKHHIDIAVKRLSIKELKNITDIPALYHIILDTVAPRGPLTIKERLQEFFESPLHIALVAGGGSLLLLILLWWFFLATHTSYARQIALLRHEPKARFTIGSGQAQKLTDFYRLTKRGTRVKQVDHITKPKTTPEQNHPQWRVGIMRAVHRDDPLTHYAYDRGRISEQSFSDAFGAFHYKLIFTEGGKLSTARDNSGFVMTFENQIAGYRYDFDDRGRVIERQNRNAFGWLRDDNDGVAIYRYRYNSDDLPTDISRFDASGNPIEDKQGISVTKLAYNDQGLVTKETYHDRYGSVREARNGVAIVERLYDKPGRLVRESYFDRSARAATNTDGACALLFIRDKAGRATRETTLSCAGQPKTSRQGYAMRALEYEGDNLVGIRYLDQEGKPDDDDRGVSIVRIAHDDAGRITELNFFGPDEQPVAASDQAHAIRFRYNEDGRPLSSTIIGLNGKPTIGAEGYAQFRFQYNDRGDVVEWAYFDAEGDLTNIHEGFAVVKTLYDQFGNQVSKSMFDREGNPAMGRAESCHRMEFTYDNKGNLAETRCFDGTGSLTPGLKSCAITKTEYNTIGKLSRVECYVDEGKLIDVPNLPSVLTAKYDKHGYTSEVRAFDAEGNPAERYQGAAIWRAKSDAYGNEIEIATYDGNGNLIDNPRYGAAIFRREFDNRGNQLRIQAFNMENKPTRGNWGFAEIRSTYNERGQQTSEAYFNEEGEPTENWQGVHDSRRAYDDRGRLVEHAFFDDEGKPVENAQGVAAIRYTYDKWDWVTGIDYLGDDGQPAVNLSLHCASEHYTNDDRGNVIKIERLDTAGALCRNENCIPVVEQTFDTNNLMNKQRFHSADGGPALDDENAAGYDYQYDQQRRISTEAVISADGKPGHDRRGVHAYHIHYRPEFDDSLWFMTFTDLDDTPMRAKNGASLKLFLYDKAYRHRLIARVFVTSAGKIVETECVDNAGNVTAEKACADPKTVSEELARIKPLLEKP